jgi:replicative superfamily II helicase
MPQVIKITDNYNLVPTSKYPFAKWPFADFNPVQSRLIETYQGDSNIAIAAATSAGKTVCSEMYLAYEIRKRGGKGIYVAPLKALAKEKEQDWTDSSHHFGDLKTFIATGDFRFTTKRLKEMEDSQLIIMTPEMLASRCRNHKSHKSKFLYEVGTVVFDESHLLTVPFRGDHIEVALMKLSEINPNIRIVLLSATMPNVDEICGWVSDMTGRDTYYLESDYRPCPLNIHYETYFDGDRSYDDKEIQKVGTACAIVEYYSNDKFLIFVHTKRTGHLMVETLDRYGVKAEFHNADLTLKERLSLEDRFKNDKSFRCLVATSTLAWGLNLPARRVIVTGVHRGLNEVENYDIQQMIGRAGRPNYDSRGDAYILIPESEKEGWIKRLKLKLPIRSTLLDFVGKAENPHYKTLAFHIVAEIHQGNVKTKESFKDWFKRSLAYYQDHAFDDQVIEKTLGLLEQFKAIYIDDDGLYQCTAIGKIASMFYYSPFDVSDLCRNFKFLFDEKCEGDDFAISIALGNIDTYRWVICNKWEKEVIVQYQSKIEKMYGKGKFTDGAIKIGCVYFNMLKGKKDVPHIGPLTGMLLGDLDRTMQVLAAIDGMFCKWDRLQWFRNLGMRLKYGVESDLVELCQIPNVGAARAKKLKAKKVKTVSDFLSLNAITLANIMKCGLKVAEEALEGARLIQLKGSIE